MEREKRCGIPEIVYGEGKDIEDLLDITEKLLGSLGRAIITRMDEKKAAKIKSKFKKHTVAYNKRARTLVVKKKNFRIEKESTIGIITAGTSDIGVAEEAKLVAEELGCNAIVEYDVGIAGVHRIFPAIEKMKNANVLIVIAGMEGALPSVVAGLTDLPVVGVPTSVGYGTADGGRTALLTMLNSCTPVAVVNIDNGFGAAVLAYKIARQND